MLALADQFPEWKDFPRGLHVMLVGEDPDVIADVRHKLNACGYLVTCYMKGEEALQELLEDRGKSFHVVVVDATTSDTFDGFKIVAAAKHLTTIMMASTENMNIMMQGIAAGASEFLQKPLSEERLKNIWQHVVRKALVTGHLAVPTTAKPLSHDVKSKVTRQFSLCSDDKEDGEFLNSVKQEKEDFCKYNGYKAVVVGEMPGATHEFVFQEADHDHESSYFDMDEKDNCEAFLCSTPPQLEQSCTRIVPTDHEDNQELVGSPSLSASQDQFNVACMEGDLNDIHDCFDDCDHYLHIKSEVEEAVNNSAILNELFDSKAKMDSDKYLLMGDDQSMPSEFDPKLCVDLQFNDLPDSLDDIGLGGDMLDDATDQSLSVGLDCLDDEDFQEADEEALLLAEVAKAEKGILLINPSRSLNSRNINNMHNSSSIDCIATVFPSYGSKSEGHAEETRCKSDSEQSCNNKSSKSPSGKKKIKVDWTPELHRRFVQAVEQLGVDKAIPSRILELMGVKCLTRHNIASHLQKYRSNRKHVLAREAEAASWNQRRQMEAAAAAAAAATAAATHARTAPTTHHQHRHPQQQQVVWPVARPLPQAQPCPALPGPPPALHVWGHPTLDHTMHFWPTWPPPGCQVDAWGKAFYPAQPILRVPLAPMPSIANMVVPPPCGKLANLHPAKETVVAAINEVLRNPYIPLPLGLKPPSLESVVSELQRQGISMAPTAIV